MKKIKFLRGTATKHDQVQMGPLADLVGIRMRQVDSYLITAFDSKKTGFARGWLVCLGLISGSPGTSQKQLSALTGIDKSLVVAIINGLEQAGLVERTVSPADRRRHALFITEKGAAALEQVALSAQMLQDRLLADISADDLSTFLNILEKMRRSCGRNFDEGEASA